MSSLAKLIAVANTDAPDWSDPSSEWSLTFQRAYFAALAESTRLRADFFGGTPSHNVLLQWLTTTTGKAPLPEYVSVQSGLAEGSGLVTKRAIPAG